MTNTTTYPGQYGRTYNSGVARRRKVGGHKLFFQKSEKQKKKKKKVTAAFKHMIGYFE